MAALFPIEDIASATDAMFLLLFIFVNLAVINLRKNRPDLDRGFKVPLFPYIPIIATILNLGLAVFLFFYRPLGVYISVGYILLGIVIFYGYSRKREFKAKAVPVIHTEQPVFLPTPRHFHILVPIANEASVESLMRMAVRIARSKNADITVLNVIRVPAQLPPSEGRKFLGGARALLEKAIAVAETESIPVYSVVKVTRNVPKAIIETCQERKIDLMILGWEGKISAHNRVFGTILDEIILNTTTDIAMICKPPAEAFAIDRILIPVSTIRYAVLSFQMAEALTSGSAIPITLLHITSTDNSAEIHQKFEEELRKREKELNTERYEIIIKKADSVADAVMNETREKDLIIMGTPEEGLVRRALFGDFPAMVAKNLNIPLILTKKYHGHFKTWFQKFFGSRKTMLD